MIMITSSVVMTLACQGCAALPSLQLGPVMDGSYTYADTVTEAAPESEGMRFAVPSAYGVDTMSPIGSAKKYPVAYEPRTTTVYTALVPGAVPEEADLFSVAITTGPVVQNGLEWSGNPALVGFAVEREAARLLPSHLVEKDFSAEFAFAARDEFTGFGFDVGVAPRVSYYEEGAFKTRRFGGEVRIGQNFDERGTGARSNSWYVFAGSDGEALIWDTGENGFANVNAVKLRDQVTVGDIQAGFSVQRGPGQFSLSYIRREVSHTERGVGTFSTDEDFAGLSFTLRH
ncbi:MAG: hypothetical protein V3V03_09340 [Hyphomonadaceae bacterium]